VRCVEEANIAAGLAAQSSPVVGALDEGVDKVAVVVGVPCHRSASIPSLAYSTRDAVRIAEMLDGNGFTVLRLTSSVDAEQLLDALDEVERIMNPEGVLVVYFSGHGVLRHHEGRLRRYLVFSDTMLPDIEDTALAVLDLQAQIAEIRVANRVVVQDTCFAGTPDEGGKSIQIASSPEGRVKGIALPERDRVAEASDQRLFASRFFEQALESIPHQGSVYTHHFLAAASHAPGADLDLDGCIGTLEAHTYATLKTAAERDGFQNPQLHGNGVENVPLTCVGEATRGVLFAGWDAQEARPLEPGRQQVLLRDESGQVRYRGSVRIEPGEWVSVEELIQDRAPYVLVHADLGVGSVGSAPTMSYGGSGWYAGRDSGLGRFAAGATVQRITRTAAERVCGRFQGYRTQARGGWWWNAGPLTVGPTVSLGLTSRTAYDACEAATFDTHAAATSAIGIHSHLSVGPLALVVDASANPLAVEENGQVEMSVKPSLTGGLGVWF